MRNGSIDIASQCLHMIQNHLMLQLRQKHLHLHVTPQPGAVGCAACRHAMLRVGAVGLTPRIDGRLLIYVERRPRTTNAIRTDVGVGSC